MALMGGRITQLRIELGMNQTQFAEKLGVSPNQLSRYERHVMNPTLETFILMADLLNTSTDYLLGRSNIPHPEEEPQPYTNETEAEMLAFLRQFDIDTQRRMMRALIALYEAWQD